MIDYIVLTKQVPDITKISDDAFDIKTGTLLRARLQNTINPLDNMAMGLVSHMRRIGENEQGKIIFLTMGPKIAVEVLKYDLARCGDIAILLTDNDFAAADTFATANTLATAIRKIENEIIKHKNYYVICGAQSVDGDTAQVPGAIAEQLKMPCVANAKQAKLKNGQFEFLCELDQNSIIAKPVRLPCVITTLDYDYPLFPTVAKTIEASKAKIIIWSKQDIKPEYAGIAGSKTQVIKAFSPEKTTRKKEQIKDAAALADIIEKSLNKKTKSKAETTCSYILPKNRQSLLDRSFEGLQKNADDYKLLKIILQQISCPNIEAIDDETKTKIIANSKGHFSAEDVEIMLHAIKKTEPSYHGHVWVIAEINKGKFRQSVFELLGKAKQLARDLKTKVGLCLACDDFTQDCQQVMEIAASGADDIYIVKNEMLREFDPVTFAKAVAIAIEKYQPQIVLFAATAKGRIIAPMIASKLKCGLTADCTKLEIKDNTKKGLIAELFQTRPALGGNLMATICTKDSTVQMATVRPGIFEMPKSDFANTANIVTINVNLTDDDKSIEIIRSERTQRTVDFNKQIVVSGGKGLLNAANYEDMTKSLSESLAKTFHATVERGASRKAVDNGLGNQFRQIGQTGQAVRPKIYVAMGISGAIQHMAGVLNSETIIAINNDPKAAIFDYCDYYVIASATEFVPKLIKAIEEKNGN